jgi:hypothetical protein
MTVEQTRVDATINEMNQALNHTVDRARDGDREAQGALVVLGIGLALLLGNLGLGWLVAGGLAALLIWLGTRKRQTTGEVNWWLVGFGSLIGLDALGSVLHLGLPVFPLTLLIIGIAIVLQNKNKRSAPESF